VTRRGLITVSGRNIEMVLPRIFPRLSFEVTVTGAAQGANHGRTLACSDSTLSTSWRRKQRSSDHSRNESYKSSKQGIPLNEARECYCSSHSEHNN